jgi:hypothetical protein
LYEVGTTRSDIPLSLHDPLCVWYLLAEGEGAPLTLGARREDVRIETTGQWTRGMCVVDRRDTIKKEEEEEVEEEEEGGAGKAGEAAEEGEAQLDFDEVPGDAGNWLRAHVGNRVWRAVDSEWKERFGLRLLERIFGLSNGN